MYENMPKEQRAEQTAKEQRWKGENNKKKNIINSKA